MHKQRKYWVRRYRRTKTVQEIKIKLNKASAIARSTKRRARRTTWQNYVSTINCKTPMAKIWKKVKKMTGKYSGQIVPSIKINGEIETDSKKVADVLGDNVIY